MPGGGSVWGRVCGSRSARGARGAGGVLGRGRRVAAGRGRRLRSRSVLLTAAMVVTRAAVFWAPATFSTHRVGRVFVRWVVAGESELAGVWLGPAAVPRPQFAPRGWRGLGLCARPGCRGRSLSPWFRLYAPRTCLPYRPRGCCEAPVRKVFSWRVPGDDRFGPGSAWGYAACSGHSRGGGARHLAGVCARFPSRYTAFRPWAVERKTPAVGPALLDLSWYSWGLYGARTRSVACKAYTLD